MMNAAEVFPPYPRAEIRAKIDEVRKRENSPMPDAALDEIVDLALHAAATARQTMFDVLARASDPRISHTAIGVAGGLLASDLRHLQGALEDWARETGKPMYHERLEVRHG